MNGYDENEVIRLDKDHSWHPFTQMSDWMSESPIIITEAAGAYLKDIHGKCYLDANASIWTNIHGHCRPELIDAITSQSRQLDHVSYLGLSHPGASSLAGNLVASSRMEGQSGSNDSTLNRVFFSDNGSTAIEAALKISHTAAQRLKGYHEPGFLSLDNGYHGDSIGAVSLGQIGMFHRSYHSLVFQVDKVMNPYCYRCPFNKAVPEPGVSSHESRKCHWECVGKVDAAFTNYKKKHGEPYAAMMMEPVIQGVAGMVVQPEGWLKQVAQIVKSHDSWLIYDEVMTGFGRTGPLFAFMKDEITPDILCLAKGITGGMMPLAATMTTENIFSAFLGEYEEMKSFFHGHSYTANPIGCSVALENLRLLNGEEVHNQDHREQTTELLRQALRPVWNHPNVGDIRQAGLVAGIELVQDRKSRSPFDWKEKVGIRVCQKLMEDGILTRPIGNIIVLMLPYCAEASDYQRLSDGICRALHEVFS